jgi:hypothetical protein
VEYCNGGVDTEYGALRAANGSAEPYNVKYWDIGNETFADWEIGHCSAEEFAKRYLTFYNAMTDKDSTIEILACGGSLSSSLGVPALALLFVPQTTPCASMESTLQCPIRRRCGFVLMQKLLLHNRDYTGRCHAVSSLSVRPSPIYSKYRQLMSVTWI